MTIPPGRVGSLPIRMKESPGRFSNNDVDVGPDAELVVDCAYSNTLPFLSLPPEVLCEIFVAIVLSRVNPQPWRRNRALVAAAEADRTYIPKPDIKRAMRLRLVSRAFRDYTNEAIFRSGILDEVIRTHHITPFVSDRPVQWAAFVQTYVATLVFRERDRDCPRGRFRRVAETLHRLDGGSERDEEGLFRRVRGLCKLTVDSGGQPALKDLVGSPPPWAAEMKYDHLVLEGAVAMGLPDVVTRLLREEVRIEDDDGGYGDKKASVWEVMTPRGHTLERLVQVAALGGDLDMLKLVLSLSPDVKPGELLGRDLVSIIIGSAALGGHAHVFHWALDNGKSMARGRDHAFHMYWAVLEQSMLLATEPETYRRSAAALAPPEPHGRPPTPDLVPSSSSSPSLPIEEQPPSAPSSPDSLVLEPFTPDVVSPEPTPSVERGLAERYGDLLSRVTTSARWNRLGMVKYVLEDERGDELGVLNNPDARREDFKERRRRARGIGIVNDDNDDQDSFPVDDEGDDDEVPFKLVPRPSLRPLLASIEGGDVAVVRTMLAHGADPNWFMAEDTALMAAVHRDNAAMVEALLDAGADVDDGLPPPIAIAVRHENEAMFRLLRRRGARLDTPETGGWAMAFACALGLDSMVDLLAAEGVERGAALHWVDGIEAKDEYCFKASDYGPVVAGSLRY